MDAAATRFHAFERFERFFEDGAPTNSDCWKECLTANFPSAFTLQLTGTESTGRPVQAKSNRH
ncbi:hypothetical protein M407DRAFT_32179 [Tulasnella calospora MUT 4182]|uniref:Uncharacterized protein n=1 Tax=Tulasnella calospora MUT 4182 TaxID=1051891 RepID=A0A0C3K9Q4_9AGAM|nr:hypothetical protein M407DRAFT_32179 [Tulasnella calospora MUT 4182]